MARPRNQQTGAPAAKPDAPKPEGSGPKPTPPVKSDAKSGIGSHPKFDKFK